MQAAGDRRVVRAWGRGYKGRQRGLDLWWKENDDLSACHDLSDADGQPLANLRGRCMRCGSYEKHELRVWIRMGPEWLYSCGLLISGRRGCRVCGSGHE
jgi:hypothetical protein